MANLNSDKILALGVSQDQYDALSLNRKSTFINLYDEDDQFVTSVNTLDMKGGNDILFLSEVLRAGELAGLVEINSMVSYKGLKFRLAALPTTELQSSLKRNLAKKEDWKKAPAPAQPAQQHVQQQQTAIQQNQNVF